MARSVRPDQWTQTVPWPVGPSVVRGRMGGALQLHSGNPGLRWSAVPRESTAGNAKDPGAVAPGSFYSRYRVLHIT